MDNSDVIVISDSETEDNEVIFIKTIKNNELIDTKNVSNTTNQDNNYSSTSNLEFSTWICSNATQNVEIISNNVSDDEENNILNNALLDDNIDEPNPILDSLLNDTNTDKLEASCSNSELNIKNDVDEEISKDEFNATQHIFDKLVSNSEEQKPTSSLKSENLDEIQKDVSNLNIKTYKMDRNPDNCDSVPLLTIKKIKNPEKLTNQEIEYQKVLPLLNKNITNADIITSKPYLYCFQNIHFKFIKIKGSVIGRHHQLSGRLSLTVDDGTTPITCIIDNPIESLSYRWNIDSDLELIKAKKNKFPKFEMTELTKLDDKVFEKKFFDGEFDSDLFITTFTEIMLEKTKIELEQYPLIKDIKFHDAVSIVGKVADLNERLIFVWHIQKISLGELIEHLTKLKKIYNYIDE